MDIKIDKEVYLKGHSLGLFYSLSLQTAQLYCDYKTKKTRFKYDFFYDKDQDGNDVINVMTMNEDHFKVDDVDLGLKWFLKAEA